MKYVILPGFGPLNWYAWNRRDAKGRKWPPSHYRRYRIPVFGLALWRAEMLWMHRRLGR